MIEITNEDCMDLMARYPDKHFELAIVDPPYGIRAFKSLKVNNNRIQKIFQKSDNFNNYIPNKRYFDELFRVTGNCIIFGANNFSLPPTEYFLVWNKLQTVDNFASAEYAWTNLRKPAKVFNYSIHLHNQVEKIHPTQKPVALYKWLLKNYAKPGDKILDTHMGSGSIAIACHDAGYSLTACEIDKDYYEAAMKRLKQHQAQIRMELFDKQLQETG